MNSWLLTSTQVLKHVGELTMCDTISAYNVGSTNLLSYNAQYLQYYKIFNNCKADVLAQRLL
jgi:hypothetical protein